MTAIASPPRSRSTTAPDEAEVDAEVCVSQALPQAGNLFPGDFGTTLPRLVGSARRAPSRLTMSTQFSNVIV
jgi:hypothetical protein